MNRETFRPQPTLPAERMVSFEIKAPLATHWRRATCVEVGCPDYQHGWTVAVSVLRPSDRELFRQKGFRFIDIDGGTGPALLFEAGQPCFRASQHRTRMDREEIFLQRPGDWRVPIRQSGALGKPVIFSSPDAFADALHTQLDKFAD